MRKTTSNSELGIKTCSKCGRTLPLDSFPKLNPKQRKYKVQQYSSFCIDCKRATDKAYQDRKRRENGAKIRRRFGKYEPLPKSCVIYICTCEITGELFVSKYSGRRFSKEGLRIRGLELSYKKFGKDRIRPCATCGTTFDKTRSSHRVYCSDECRDIMMRKLKAERNRQIGKNHNARARHYGVVREPVNKTRVFIRDKWTCQRCGCKTPKRLVGLNIDNSPELDHIIPLSKGGPHTYSNVRCICRRCNIEKSDKLEGQLVLCA